MLEVFLPKFTEYLRSCGDNFQAGRISAYIHEWEKLTSDPKILETVKKDDYCSLKPYVTFGVDFSLEVTSRNEI